MNDPTTRSTAPRREDGTPALSPTPEAGSHDGTPSHLVRGRFEVMAALGRGSFGSVYAVKDTKTDVRFALKRLDHDRAGAIARFKAEFRALTELRHPNLVRLYELFNDEGRWLFTMELVVGVDPLTTLDVGAGLTAQTATFTEDPAEAAPPSAQWWSGPAAPQDTQVDPERVRSVFGGIAQGVAALHRAGLLHRDLKPSNILVDRQGTAKLLDFGLVALLDDVRPGSGVAGTRPYMAPELFAGEAASPASDWFAFGVVLHQALTGQLPPPARPDRLPDTLLAERPGALSELCRALLHPEANQRPHGEEILGALGATVEPATTPWRSTAAAPFVGRQTELSALMRCFEQSRQRPLAALVVGTSGAGKSALTRRFIEQLGPRPELFVASGRCFVQEALPLKAFDGLVESLGRGLRDRFAGDTLGLDPEDCASLLRLFPDLASWMGPSDGHAPLSGIEPQILRRRAVAAFERLLTALGDRCTLVLHIDDVQWGDAESGELLMRLLTAGPPLLVVATCRSEEAADSAFLGALQPDAVNVEHIEVSSLGPDECRQLARALVPPDRATEPVVEALVRESDGSPFFVEQLARAWNAAPRPLSLDEVVGDRVNALADTERRVVELLAVAGRPIDRSLLFEIPALGGDAWDALDRLLGLRMVRIRGSDHGPTPDDPRIESYHDKIQQTVLTGLSKERESGHHLALAEAMEGIANAERGRVAEHFARAGHGDRAIPHAIVAADEAVEGLAFERAVDLYGLAIEQLDAHHPGDPRTRPLRIQRADTLVQAGRCAQAAPLYEALASSAEDPTQLQQRAAAQWMTSGHYDRGISLLRQLLPASGLPWPRRDLGAVARIVGLVIRLRLRPLRVPTTPSARPSDERLARQLELCWSASRGLVSVDLARGTYYYLRGALLCTRSGDPHRIVQSLGGTASLLRSFGLALGRRLWAQAQAVAAELDDPHVHGLMDYFEGFTQISRGRYHEANTALRSALGRLEHHGRGVALEVTVSRSMLCDCMYMLGQMEALEALASDSHARARALGDIQGTIGSLLFVGLARLVRADSAGARHSLHEVDRLETLEAYSFQRAVSRQFLVRCDLYDGLAAAGWRRSQSEWAAFARSGLYWSPIIRARALSVRGAAFVAALLADDPALPDARRLRRGVVRCARALRRTGQAWAEAEARALRAAIHAREGDHERARTGLREAARAFAHEGMHLRAALCEARLAQLDDDPTAFAHQEDQIRSCGVEDPSAWLRAYTPWPEAALRRSRPS